MTTPTPIRDPFVQAAQALSTAKLSVATNVPRAFGLPPLPLAVEINRLETQLLSTLAQVSPLRAVPQLPAPVSLSLLEEEIPVGMDYDTEGFAGDEFMDEFPDEFIGEPVEPFDRELMGIPPVSL